MEARCSAYLQLGEDAAVSNSLVRSRTDKACCSKHCCCNASPDGIPEGCKRTTNTKTHGTRDSAKPTTKKYFLTILSGGMGNLKEMLHEIAIEET